MGLWSDKVQAYVNRTVDQYVHKPSSMSSASSVTEEDYVY